MKDNKIDINERVYKFTVSVMNLIKRIDRNTITKNILYQLGKSATAVGSNLEEAQGAYSKKDFLNKMCICHKEIKESKYWLKLLHSTGIVTPNLMIPLLNESDQLVRIFGSIVGKVRHKLNSENS